jgi:hypothetical protein
MVKYTPYIIAYTRRWKLGTIGLVRVRIGGHRRGRAIRRAQYVGTEYEKSRRIESLPWPHERSPPEKAHSFPMPIQQKGTVNAPVFDIYAAGECVANNHYIVARLIELSPCLIRYRHIAQFRARFKNEKRNLVDALIDQGGKASGCHRA